MIVLDSNHSADHVANELETYAPLVTPGSCLVVEDAVMKDLADVPGAIRRGLGIIREPRSKIS
jgi:cephalosporin hydroxylase